PEMRTAPRAEGVRAESSLGSTGAVWELGGFRASERSARRRSAFADLATTWPPKAPEAAASTEADVPPWATRLQSRRCSPWYSNPDPSVFHANRAARQAHLGIIQTLPGF